MQIAHVAALYALALANAPGGQFMNVENGEESLGEISCAIAARLNLGPPILRYSKIFAFMYE